MIGIVSTGKEISFGSPPSAEGINAAADLEAVRSVQEREERHGGEALQLEVRVRAHLGAPYEDATC